MTNERDFQHYLRLTGSVVSQLNIMARGSFHFGPFRCGLGADKQMASSYDEKNTFMHK